MNAPQHAQRSTAAVVVQSLMWLWLIGLSVFVALGYQAVNEQADQKRLDSRLQHLEAQAASLTEAIDAIQQRPAVATAADLKDTRELLEARAAQVETTLSGYAAADDLQALRTEVNGEVRQLSRTSMMIHDIGAIIEWISAVMTLLPGDLILTGTPEGVGPIENGDTVSVSVEGIGTLTNPVVRKGK